MSTPPVDTGIVLWRKTRARTYPVTGKIVTLRKIPLMTGGTRIASVSLPAISMHMAALEAAGRKVSRRG
jgi:hypothetical protein